MARGGSVLAALVLLVACVAAGGGDSLSPRQYRARLAALGRESDAAQGIITRGLKAKTVPALVTALAQFARSQDRLGDEVAALQPPANAQAANAQLAKGLHDIAAAVRGVARKVKGLKRVAQAKGVLDRDTAGLEAGREVDAALTRLRRLGYAPG